MLLGHPMPDPVADRFQKPNAATCVKTLWVASLDACGEVGGKKQQPKVKVGRERNQDLVNLIKYTQD